MYTYMICKSTSNKMAMVFFTLLLFSTVSQAQYCDGFPYLTINSATSADVVRVETSPVVSLTQVCNTGLELNAIGIDPISGEIVGWDDPNDRLVRVDGACAATTVPLTGAVNTSPRFLLGDVSQDGSTYVTWRAGLTDMLVVDLGTGVATEVAIQGNIQMADWTFGADGLLYGIDGITSTINTIDPTNGQVVQTSFATPGVSGGAVWFDQNDDFWIYEQSTGELNQILIGSGSGGIVAHGTGVTVSGADGAACAQSFSVGPTAAVAAPTMTTLGVVIMLILILYLSRRVFKV